MIDEKYTSYIQSIAWRKKADKRKEMDGHKCMMCGATENLHVHHLHYRRLFRENVAEDLVTLCKACHEKVHQNKEEVIHGMITGILAEKMMTKPYSIRGFLNSIGIQGEESIVITSETEIAGSMGALKIPVEPLGAIVIPYSTFPMSGKDHRKICKYVGLEYDEMQKAARKLYYAALEDGGYID